MKNIDRIVPMEEGCSGKAEILRQSILSVINDGEFDDMTIAEVTGVLFGLAVNYSK
jgi:hypothetical protein